MPRLFIDIKPCLWNKRLVNEVKTSVVKFVPALEHAKFRTSVKSHNTASTVKLLIDVGPLINAGL